MTRRRDGKPDKERAATEPTSSAVTVTVCRGCCCGSRRKHPAFDHEGQLELIRAGGGDDVRVRVADCLDACERSNVMVVTPSAAGRAAGARPVWLGDLLDDDVAADVIEWAASGGPGVAEAPAVLDLYEFRPSRRARGGLVG